jgi:glucokinase
MIELAESRSYRSPFIDRLKQGEPRSSSLMYEAVGDELGGEVIREAGEYLGCGFVSLLNLLNPAMIVIGGGVAVLGDALLDPAREVAREYALRGDWDPVRIVRAELGNNAGLVGAASLGWEDDHS